MKKILVFVAAMFVVNANAKSILVLEFKTEKEKKIWKEWFLDQNSEDQSGFYANDWNDYVMHLEFEKLKANNTSSILNKKIKISDLVYFRCQSSLHLNPQVCYSSVVNCINSMNKSRMYFSSSFPQKELEIVNHCLAIE